MIKNRTYSVRAAAILLLVCSLALSGIGCAQKDQEETPDKEVVPQETPVETPTDPTPDTVTGASELPELTEPISGSHFLLNTFVSIKLYDRGSEELIQECFDLIQKYEDMLSRTIATSEISRLNTAGGQPVTVSEDTTALLQMAL